MVIVTAGGGGGSRRRRGDGGSGVAGEDAWMRVDECACECVGECGRVWAARKEKSGSAIGPLLMMRRQVFF